MPTYEPKVRLIILQGGQADSCLLSVHDCSIGGHSHIYSDRMGAQGRRCTAQLVCICGLDLESFHMGSKYHFSDS